MTTKEIRKIEKMANESLKYAHRSLAKSNEVQTILSLLEAKSGKVKRFTSVNAAFKKLKI